MFKKVLKLQRFIHKKKTLIFKNNQIHFVKNQKKIYVSYLCVISPNQFFSILFEKDIE